MTTPAPKHIVIAVRELGIGGSERQASVVARLLDPRLFRVTMGCFIPRGIRRAELDAAGIAVVEFPLRSFLSWRWPAIALNARRWMLREQVALVHSFDYPTAVFFGAALAPMKRFPLLTSLRSFRSLTPQPYRSLLRHAERFSDRIVVNSAEVRKDLLDREGLPSSRLHLVYNAVEPGAFPPPPDLTARPRPPELAGATLVIGSVCGIRVEKDLPTLMRAVAALRADVPGLRLVLVGSGPAEAQVVALRRELRLEDACLLVPQTSNPQPWYAAMDIFVLPSTSEALSNALLEAMCSECATVASRVGGNVEIIESGVNGFLFPATDVAALAETLRALAADPAGRLALARKGRESVVERFSPAAAASNLARLYGELTGNSGAA